MKIELESLELNAFRDFDLSQTIDLPINQVVAIVGKNNDDGGSNGTGKSSFAMAANVNLFGPSSVGISTKDLKNWHLNSAAYIIGKYRLDGRLLVVDRVLGGKLRYQFDESPWKEGKVDDIQAEINNILKITPDQLMALSCKRQGEFGGFLKMKDSEKKEFLSSFFDVSSIDRAKAEISSQFTLKTKIFDGLSGQLTYIDGTIASQKKSLEASQSELAKVDSDVVKSEIVSLKQQIETSRDQYNAIQDILRNQERLDGFYAMSDSVRAAENELNSIKERVKNETDKLLLTISDREAESARLKASLENTPVVPLELTNQKTQIEAVIATLRKSQATFNTYQVNLQLNQARILNTELELKKNDDQTCPSCGVPLSLEKIQAAKIQLNIKLSNYIDEQNKLKVDSLTHVVSDDHEKKALEFQANINAQIASFYAANDKSQLKKEYEAIMAELSLLQYKKTMLEVSVGDAIRRVQAAKDEIKQRMESSSMTISIQTNNAQISIQNKETAIKIATRDVEKNKSNLDKSLADHAQIFQQRIETGENMEILEHCSKITSKDGFIGYIFDSLLEDLNSEINENIKLIPNARKFSLQFQSDKIVKSTGNVNKNITYQIMSGDKEVNFDTLSGGEQLSVIVAVEEALDTVVSRRLGIKIGWKFLDEQFFWIDENSKEAILDYYRSKSSDKTYLIVDHASEFNASFDKKITIIKENDIARFL